MPTQDRGVVTERHGAFLVCDAAIVAFIAAKRFAGSVHLITNNLGSVEYESEVIRTKLNGVAIYEDPLPFRGAPIDMIFVDRARGTRSFVTTNYYPSRSHLLTATREVCKALGQTAPIVFYVDIEAGSDSGAAALEASVGLIETASVWNVGQVTRLSDVEDWLAGTTMPERAIVQVSLGNSSVTTAELRSTFKRIASAADQTLVVTLGSTGAAWANDTQIEVLTTEPVSNAFTLGAGAVFASSLVCALAEGETTDVGTLIPGVVAVATQYVSGASVDHDMLGLDFW